MKTLFQHISIILVAISLSACQTEDDRRREALEERMTGMSPEDRNELQEVADEYEETISDIDRSTPIQLTMDLQSALDKIYCTGTFGWIGTFGSSSLAKCSEGRIAVCGTQGSSTEAKPYCVIHDAEADQYYRVLSETPNDHCEDDKEVVCD